MIKLILKDLKFENDFRALLMAFYPGEKLFVDRVADQLQQTVSDKVKKKKQRESFPDEEVTAVLTVESYEQGQRLILSRPNKSDVIFSQRDLPKKHIEAKNIMKNGLYDMLAEQTGRRLPWGILTGIRPTKLAMTEYENGGNASTVDRMLKEIYQVSDEKRKLCTTIALNEKKILDDIKDPESLSLYVGIPFCPTICLYCSFSSFPLNIWENHVEDYLDALLKEMRAVKNLAGDRPLTSVYMGGGTPTSLSADQMDRLLTEMETIFDVSHAGEFTVEAGRPDSLNIDKLRVIRSHGIDRISVNPQTMNQKTLDIIGRRHTVEDVIQAFEMGRAAGFDNINMDMIMGLPGETTEDVARTLEMIKILKPDSLTVHSLAIKRASRLKQNLEKYPQAPVSQMDAMVDMAGVTAHELGMEPYYMYRQKNMAGNMENVGYAIPGKECIYNILIMEEKQSIIAMGASGTSKLFIPEENIVARAQNVKSVRDYISRVDEMILRKRELFGQ